MNVLSVAARYAEGQDVSMREQAVLAKASRQSRVVSNLVQARENEDSIKWTEWIEAKDGYLT